MDFKALIAMLLGVLFVAIILTVSSSNLGVEYEEMAQGVASISVALAFFGVVLLALADPDIPRGACVIFGGMAGTIFAFIIKALYDKGILIDEFITGTITIADLMVMTVIVWVLLGIILEVSRR